eukprot:176332_1
MHSSIDITMDLHFKNTDLKAKQTPIVSQILAMNSSALSKHPKISSPEMYFDALNDGVINLFDDLQALPRVIAIGMLKDQQQLLHQRTKHIRKHQKLQTIA